MLNLDLRQLGVRWVGRGVVGFVVLIAVSTFPLVAVAGDADGPPSRPFAVVFDGVVQGDLVVAANSNFRSAGGWSAEPSAVGDVDGDRSSLCVLRRGAPPACDDNSSSAHLDIPLGSRILRARLYVETSLSANAGTVRVRLAGPRASFDYTLLDDDTVGVPKLHEDSAAVSTRAVMRQAVWDVTDYVASNGAGTYTVADILGERAGAFMPYASWAIVAAYELDPAVDVSALAAEQRQRFTRRAVSWQDGFLLLPKATNARPVAELEVALVDAVSAKSLHIAAGARRGEADNLLFNGRPLGNNVTPGDSPPAPGVAIGADQSCNSTTDVFNETICVLGTPAQPRDPGPADFLASSDGTTPSSGSAVDIDVIRIPERYLVGDPPSSVLSVTTTGEALALGMLAISAELPPAPS